MSKNLEDAPPITILNIQRAYSGFLNIDRVTAVQADFQGREHTVERTVMERGDSVALLLHDPEKRKVILVRQARIPPVTRNDSGWTLEIIAGAVAADGDKEGMVIREAREEAGIIIEAPGYLGSFYLSPGGSSERCHLFEAAVDSSGVQGRLAGEEGSDERTRVEVIDYREALRMIDSGEICDAKTIIALQKPALGGVRGWPSVPLFENGRMEQ